MKKFIAFLLALMMFTSIFIVSVFASEATNEAGNSSNGYANCSCGGSYGDWKYPDSGVCQGGRYERACKSCSAIQTAKDITPTTIPYAVPAIGANTNDVVTLSLYDVYFTSSQVIAAENIVWSSDDIEIVNGQVCPANTGVYELIAKSGSSTKSIYLVVKNPTDTEYVLYFDNFERDLNGDGKYDERAEVTDSGYKILQKPNGTDCYIQDGKLILNALGNAGNQMRVLLPKWIGNFGDYKIDTVFAMNETVNDKGADSYWFAVMARVGNYNNGYPLWQAAIRKAAKDYYSQSAYRGVEISNKTSSSASWSVPYKGQYTENLTLGKNYTISFDVLGKEATNSINGNLILDTRTDTDKLGISNGYVGFHLRASKVSVDSIKIVVPIDDTIHSFSAWTTVTADTCAQDGLEERICKNCNAREERVIVGGHKYIDHKQKVPTCTESGWSAYQTCERCDYTTFKGEVGPLGHYFDREFHSVAHRGYSDLAPENTLPAYILAHQLGYIYVECDIMLTKDGVAVLFHDNNLSDKKIATGKISDYTYEELLQYDFGSWKDAEFTGTKIPTFEEFIALCKKLGLHPYLELKDGSGFTQNNVNGLVAIVEQYDMEDNCSWISFNANYLKYVKNADNTARLGYVSSSLNDTVINTAKGLRTETNEVFLNISYTVINDTTALLAASNGFALEAWTIDDATNIKKLPKYVSGVSSNKLFAETYFLTSAVTNPTCNEQGYTTFTCVCGETKTDKFVPATGDHTSVDGVCSVCGTVIYCTDPTHNLEIISISYANGYDKAGIKIVKCLDCDSSESELTAVALFTCLGYSVLEDGRIGVAAGFTVNHEAISEYENVTGKTVRYGAFAVTKSNIGSNEIFDENGNLAKGTLFADATDYNFDTFYVKIVGFADNQKALPFAMGACVTVSDGNGKEYSYIQSELPDQNEKYDFVTYNSIVNSKEDENEVNQ